ncbi:MAG: helix-turn-helix domain-containing protein [Thiohalomonadales bacterium]
MSIGATVSVLRKARGLSLDDIEKITGISKATLSRYERNLEGLGTDKFDKLCILFHTSPSVLYAVAKCVAQRPEILDNGETLHQLVRGLSQLIDSYLNATDEIRQQVDNLLKN